MFQAYSIFCVLSLTFAFGLSQGNSGLQCVPIRDCPSLSSMLKPPLSPQKLGVLRSALCGYDKNNHPIVKCAQPVTITVVPTCQTPDGKTGTCIPANECSFIVDFLRSQNEHPNVDIVSYIEKLRCKNHTDANAPIQVCCATAQQPPVTETNSTEPSSPKKQSNNTATLLPNPEQGQCGLQETNTIIGRKVTEIEEFPWTALLEYSSREGVKSTCVGSLINNKYVVTAAHCVDIAATRYLGNPTNVILGEFDKTTAKDCTNYMGIEDCADPPLRVSIVSVILHDQWETSPRGQINHDIALIRLAEAVTFTNSIKPICLPSMTLTVGEKDKFMVTGWGKTSAVKLKATVALANLEECAQKYKTGKSLDVGDGEICGGDVERGDTCPKDSGGPLMLSRNVNGNGIWFLVGVASFRSTQTCGVNDYPDLYTYLPKYIDWIAKTVKA